MKLRILVTILSMLSLNTFASSGRLKTDIVDTAASVKSFSTLVAAVKAANLVEVLKGPGPFTVLAPTNSAFNRLPNGTVSKLVKDIPALTNILTYHVLGGEYSIESLLNEGKKTTLQGKDITIRMIDQEIFINGSKVLDILKVKNGQIIVIDTVLLP